nr:hypothetical protein [Propionivibrio limicola]
MRRDNLETEHRQLPTHSLTDSAHSSSDQRYLLHFAPFRLKTVKKRPLSRFSAASQSEKASSLFLAQRAFFALRRFLAAFLAFAHDDLLHETKGHSGRLGRRGRLRPNFHFPGLTDNAPEAGKPGVFNKHAGFTGSFALFFHPPIGVMTDAADLANHNIGGRQGAVDAMQIFLPPSVVMHKPATIAFDDFAVGVDGTGTPADTKDTFPGKRFRLTVDPHQPVGWRGGPILSSDTFTFLRQHFDRFFGIFCELAQPNHFQLQFLLPQTQRIETGFGIKQALGESLALFQEGNLATQNRHFVIEPLIDSTTGHNIGFQICHLQPEFENHASLFGALTAAFLTQRLIFLPQFRALLFQSLYRMMVGARPSPDLVLQHMDIGMHILFQDGVARGMRAHGPEHARNFNVVARCFTPRQPQFTRCFEGGKLLDDQGVAAIQNPVHLFRQRAALAAYTNRDGMPNVIGCCRRILELFANDLAQFRHIETHADNRAVIFLR